MSDQPTQWLTMAEATEFSGYCRDTLIKWIKTGYLVQSIHYCGERTMRRFDKEMLDIAVRFQNDPQAHEQAIAAKRKAILKRR